MGKVWLQTSAGKRIHLPVVGADVNTPDTAILVSAASALLNNRCLSGTVSVVHPTYGTITIDFTVPGRTGSCNQCGSCCTHPVASCPSSGNCGYILDTQYNVHKCQYLQIDNGPNRLGSPGRTSCTIYATLLDTFKGCLHGPQKPEEKWAWMTNCGYSFG